MIVTRTSRALEVSERRLERLLSIQPPPDFGTGFSLADYAAKIDLVSTMSAEYNGARSIVDAKLTALKKVESELLDYRERILTAVAFMYGKDSEQYVAAGGVRKSEIKRGRSGSSSSNPVAGN
jgi:hypothetical protein